MTNAWSIYCDLYACDSGTKGKETISGRHNEGNKEGRVKNEIYGGYGTEWVKFTLKLQNEAIRRRERRIHVETAVESTPSSELPPEGG